MDRYDELRDALAKRDDLRRQIAELSELLHACETHIDRVVELVHASARTKAKPPDAAKETSPIVDAPPEMPPRWFQILEALTGRDTLDLKELTSALSAENTEKTRSTMSSHLSRLKEAGYVASPSRARFQLTEEGLTAVRAIRAHSERIP
jgi:DNA-binding transcriptional ArsR family regulator